jgi:hypothetical protein
MSLRLSLSSVLPTLLLSCAAAACGGGDDDDASDGGNTECEEALEHSDLDWIQENVFNGSCASATACHRGDAEEANGLNLEAGNSQANMVNVPAMADSADGLDLVEPGDPESSYLMVILGQFGEDDPRIPESTGTMPFNSGLLCQEERDAIARWIDSL